jgi:hypothetical protein
MQRLLIILFPSLLCSAILGQGVITGPKVREIVKEFYSRYTTDDLEYPRVTFEKRKEGWYVITQRINKNKLDAVNKFFFYENKSKKYKPLSIEKNEENKEINPSEYMEEFDLRNYDLQIYYGYKGWYKDVIGEFKNRRQLSDNEMNGLARAYSTYAAGLLSDQYGDAPEIEIWRLPLKMNCLSLKQINEFNVLEAKAREYFKKLADRNPGYETTVGKIGMKYANEVMFQFTILLAHANNYAVKMQLPAKLYTDEQLIAPKAILESCPENGIFLSLGDNDYYPLHYLQHAKGFRRDVYVINYSLIGLDRYIYQATQPQYDAQAIKLTADTSLYGGNKHELIYIKDSSYSIDFTNLIWLMKSAEKDDFGRVTLKADKILLSIDKSIDTGGIAMEKKRVVPISGAKYIFKQQWILLDILNNLNNRKICFPNHFVDELKGLNDHLINNTGLLIYN